MIRPRPLQIEITLRRVLTSQTAANGTGSALGDVKRGQHGGGTDTETGDESTDEHEGERAARGRSSLHDDTDASDKTGSDEREATSVAVSEPGGDETGEEAATLKGGDD